MVRIGVPELILFAIIGIGLLWFLLKLVTSLRGVTIPTEPRQHSLGRAAFVNAFCTKCGATLSDEMVFCGKCGAKRS